ncbi:MAG: hypothetical protein SFV54_20620 [Bryobacteraceae bacterium]|nr:hypothetical protein [Bryobacteraceae bacterium]
MIGILVAGSAFAQRGRGGGGGGGGRGYGPGSWTPQNHVGTWTANPAPTYGHGFGNVVFPGGVRPATSNVWGYTGGFAAALGATVGGWPPYTGAPVPSGHRGYGNVVTYPVFVGGYGYNYPVTQQPNVIVVAPPQGYMYPPPQQQQPQVVINQHYTPDTARPVMREYSAPSGAPANDPAPAPSPTAGAVADEPATIYLIAFRNGQIQAAYAYWLDGQTLHYVTTKGSHNRATVDLIDRELSERLNRERKVEFSLSGASATTPKSSAPAVRPAPAQPKPAAR